MTTRTTNHVYLQWCGIKLFLESSWGTRKLQNYIVPIINIIIIISKESNIEQKIIYTLVQTFMNLLVLYNVK